jgi:uncharacterized protein
LIVYFDSSAFVKLLVEEDGSGLAAQLWDAADAVVSSRLGYPEVRAALAAAGRSGRLEAAGQLEAETAWEEFWSAVRPVELTEPLAKQAGELARDCALRGADGVHLASVLTLGVANVILAVWDVRFAAAAQTVGVRTVPAV